jgi:hypothetical protein
MNPSWSSKKPSLASKVLETPHLWGFAENELNRYDFFTIGASLFESITSAVPIECR